MTPGAGTGAGVAETHAAVVVFLGERAYKVKKRVDLGFLDFRSRAAREAACHDEVALNRRLAPDVYLGVADVVGPDGELCDHLVVMRRMPADRRLSALVEADTRRRGRRDAEGGRDGAGAAGDAGTVDLDGELWRLAHLVAAFHARAERGPAADEAAGAAATARRWADNAEEMAALPGSPLAPDEVAAVHRLARRYIEGRGPLFAARVAQGRAVDGHGDLLADDVFCLPDGPRVLDCIEFDARFRLGDGLADVAFLAMDLERLGRPDLARRFLDAYREHAGDAWPASLAHHHVAYRAQVRAKVAAIRATQGAPGAAEEARGLLALARRHLEAGAARLVLVGGLPGTGKSTLAAGLGRELGATVLRSDEVRKELAGLPADRRVRAGFRAGLYADEATAATYGELLRRARVGLSMGETVVLDASWGDAGRREAARRVARDTVADLVELRCAVAPEVAAERIRRRLAAGGDPSDATPEVAAALAAVADPWPEARPVDTSGPPAAALDRALGAVRAAPGVPPS